MKKNVIVAWSLALVGIAAVFLFVFVPALNKAMLKKAQEQTEVAVARAHLVILSAALKNYAGIYGDLPSGNTATVLAALTGQNPRRIVFLAIHRSRRASTLNQGLDP